MEKTKKIIQEFELEMRENNLHEMQKLLHEKYKQLENFTCLASPDTVTKHEKKLDDINSAIVELKTLLASHLKSDERTQELIEKLFDRAETNSHRINSLEVTQKVIAGIFGVFIVCWTAGKLIFK
jgi:hypothetical protein